MTRDDWLTAMTSGKMQPNANPASTLRYWLGMAWDAGRAEGRAEMPVAGTVQSAVFDGGLPAIERDYTGIGIGGVWYDLVKREPASPALTRDAILRWPESDDGRQRLLDECAKIAGLKRGLVSGLWFDPIDIDHIVGPKSYDPWLPDRDANQCRLVKAALVERGFNIWLTTSKDTSSGWYAEVFASADNMRWGDAHAATEEMALCVCACIAVLVAP